VLLGITLAILIGLLTGRAYELLMDAARSSPGDVGGVLKVVSGLFGIPGVWFGGGWLSSSSILQDVDVTKIRSAYLVTLSAIFTAFVLWDVYRRRAVPPPPTAPAGTGDA
jgi:hypothetical protein